MEVQSTHHRPIINDIITVNTLIRNGNLIFFSPINCSIYQSNTSLSLAIQLYLKNTYMWCSIRHLNADVIKTYWQRKRFKTAKRNND